MKKHYKWIAVCVGMMVVIAALAGCMNTAGRVNPNTEPSGQPENSVMPGLNFGETAQPEANPSDLPEMFDWMTMGKSIENRINMLSEIQNSRVIVNGNMALVGVTFAAQYQGEMTERIHDMVAGEIQAADANVQSVAVTAEEEDVRKINELADQIAMGTPVNELEGEIDAIIRNVTTVQ